MKSATRIRPTIPSTNGHAPRWDRSRVGDVCRVLYCTDNAVDSVMAPDGSREVCERHYRIAVGAIGLMLDGRRPARAIVIPPRDRTWWQRIAQAVAR